MAKRRGMRLQRNRVRDHLALGYGLYSLYRDDDDRIIATGLPLEQVEQVMEWHLGQEERTRKWKLSQSEPGTRTARTTSG